MLEKEISIICEKFSKLPLSDNGINYVEDKLKQSTNESFILKSLTKLSILFMDHLELGDLTKPLSEKQTEKMNNWDKDYSQTCNDIIFDNNIDKILEPDKYIMVGWPEIQDYMDNPRWSECIFCQEITNHPVGDSTYMVPEDLYNEVHFNSINLIL